jgi:hypothetical protein
MVMCQPSSLQFNHSHAPDSGTVIQPVKCTMNMLTGQPAAGAPPPHMKSMLGTMPTKQGSVVGGVSHGPVPTITSG